MSAEIDLARLCRVMRVPVLVDGRNMLDGQACCAAGVQLTCVGKAQAEPSLVTEAPMESRR